MAVNHLLSHRFAHHQNCINLIMFMFDYYVILFVDVLPPTWHGRILLGDQTLSKQEGGCMSMPQYKECLKSIHDVVNLLRNDPRVCWIEGHGILKEMRMYSQDGKKYVAWLQQFHNYCTNTGINGEAMTVCSNVTNMAAQLLLGQALGPKADFMVQAKQNPSNG